jgi:hypothetical protein
LQEPPKNKGLSMMRKHGAIFLVLLFVLASCNFFEPQPFIDAKDTETPEIVELTAGPSVDAKSNAEEAIVMFLGAVGSAPATADFTVTTGGTPSTVSVNTRAVFVKVSFAANTTGKDKTYTVGIAPNSTKIKGTASVVITQKADAEAVLKESRKGLTAGAPVDVASDATEATVTFTGAQELTLTAADFTVGPGAEISLVRGGGDIVSVTVIFPVNTTGEDKIYTVGIAEDSTKIKGPAQVNVTHGPAPLDVDSVDKLADLITDIKNRPREADRVIRLTEDFYTYANAAAGFIVVDAGDTNNDIPYTIRGLGTKPGTPALKTGILLANDNITLEDVTFTITDSGKAAPCSWEDYKAAVSIGRSSNGADLLTGEDLVCENVIVKNSIISITGSAGFTAGIYVCGTTDGSSTIYPSTKITIEDNTITAIGFGGNAVQAINIAIWHPSIAITGNYITVKYGTRPGPRYGDKPASAIYVGRVFGEDLTESNDDPNISGNTLVSDVYSFYFNAYKIIEVKDENKTGVTVLRNDNFAVAETTWALSNATDMDSTYKKLFNALKANITGKGFGYAAVPVDLGTPGNPDVAFDVEQYEITNGEVIAISVYGDHLVGDAYAGDGAANKFGGPGTGYDYGRKLASAPDDYNALINRFCYGLLGNDYEYDATLDPND